MQKIDIKDVRFGRLVAISPIRTRKGTYWLCVCDCGEKSTVALGKLRGNNTTSCGCLQKELRDNIGNRSRTHGESRTALYKTWARILNRCNNPNTERFPRYGGRGIMVCKRWKEFKNFADDMRASFKKGLSLDRIDNNGDYSKENCRWATLEQQMNNTSNNRILVHDGKTMTMAEWARYLNIKNYILRSRFHRDWSVERALTQMVRPSYNK